MGGIAHTQIEPALAPSRQNQLILTVEGIKFDSPPEVHYQVYINLPKNEEPNYKRVYFVETSSGPGQNAA